MKTKLLIKFEYNLIFTFFKIFNRAFLFLKCIVSLEFNFSTSNKITSPKNHHTFISPVNFTSLRTIQDNLGSETTADRIALMIPRLRNWRPMMGIEWASARTNGQEGVVAPRNESPQLSAQLFASEDAPKAAVNLICLAGDVAGRKTIGEIANRGKRLTEGKSLLAVFFECESKVTRPHPGRSTIPIMKPLQAALHCLFFHSNCASHLPRGYHPRQDFLD